MGSWMAVPTSTVTGSQERAGCDVGNKTGCGRGRPARILLQFNPKTEFAAQVFGQLARKWRLKPSN
jgi:hypothetical protein